MIPMRLFPDSRLQNFYINIERKGIKEYAKSNKKSGKEKKRLVRYKEGAEMYSMGMNKFQTLAKDAGAILKIDRMVLVDLDIFDQYLETFRVQ